MSRRLGLVAAVVKMAERSCSILLLSLPVSEILEQRNKRSSRLVGDEFLVRDLSSGVMWFVFRAAA